MAGYDVSVGKELLPGLLSGQDGLAKLVEVVLNQILEAQVSESLGADRHERSEERQGYRNGYRPRTLFTRVGPVTLQVPQTRDGSFSTDIFKRYQRSEQAFVLALMEMVVQGVSTRKVSTITEELCGASFCKSTVTLCVPGWTRGCALSTNGDWMVTTPSFWSMLCSSRVGKMIEWSIGPHWLFQASVLTVTARYLA